MDRRRRVVLTLALTVGACTRDNPEFDEPTAGSVAGESGSASIGGEGGDGDGDPTSPGDGDGDVGDGDGDGDGAPGDGDGIPGDGDGEPIDPLCGELGEPLCNDGTPVAGELCFSAPNEVALGGQISALAAADFDGDGFDDLAFAQAGELGVQVLRGSPQGLGGVSQMNAEGATRDIAFGDLNGDGHLDLAALSITTRRVIMWLGTGNGTLAPPGDINLDPAEVPERFAVADFNADGRDDVAVLYFGGLSLWIADNNLVFQELQLGFPPGHAGGTAIDAGDLDGQGGMDLAIGGYDTGTTAIILNPGNGNMDAFGVYENHPGGSSDGALVLRIAEISQDGQLDVVVTDRNYTSIYTHLSAGAPTFNPGPTLADVGDVQALDLADFDHDCANDLVHHLAGNVDELVIRRNTNDASGGFGAGLALPYAAGPVVAVVAGDFNGDGEPDVAATNGSAVLSWLMTP